MTPTVLIVDDSVVIRASVKHVLEGAGYAVAEAVNGKDGLRVLDRLDAEGSRPAMVVSDVNMPEMDGIAFVTELKKRAQWKYLPVLVLTTESEPGMKERGKAAGAAGWLVKPFQAATLIGVVRKFARA